MGLPVSLGSCTSPPHAQTNNTCRLVEAQLLIEKPHCSLSGRLSLVAYSRNLVAFQSSGGSAMPASLRAPRLMKIDGVLAYTGMAYCFPPSCIPSHMPL